MIELLDHEYTQDSNRLIEHGRHSSSFSLFPVDRPIRREPRAAGERSALNVTIKKPELSLADGANFNDDVIESESEIDSNMAATVCAHTPSHAILEDG